jgi:hypothetical protein
MTKKDTSLEFFKSIIKELIRNIEVNRKLNIKKDKEGRSFFDSYLWEILVGCELLFVLVVNERDVHFTIWKTGMLPSEGKTTSFAWEELPKLEIIREEMIKALDEHGYLEKK